MRKLFAVNMAANYLTRSEHGDYTNQPPIDCRLIRPMAILRISRAGGSGFFAGLRDLVSPLVRVEPSVPPREAILALQSGHLV